MWEKKSLDIEDDQWADIFHVIYFKANWKTIKQAKKEWFQVVVDVSKNIVFENILYYSVYFALVLRMQIIL